MASKKSFGCFTFPAIVFISIVGSGVVQAFLPISSFYAFALLLLILSWGLGKIQKTEHKKFPHRYFVYSLVFLGVIIGFRFLLSVELPDPKPKTADIPEEIYREKLFEKGDSIVLLSQNRSWKDNYGNPYKANFSVREEDYITSKNEYINYTKRNRFQNWGRLYQYLSTTDATRLDLILDKLLEIKTSQQLNQFEFAEMVVTFIQDIPYALVFRAPCGSADKYEESSIREVLEECPSCCIGNIPYGIQNPVAFMGDLKGDCDTRTVIIYAILDYFGYDVAILNSEYYRHSILGLHIPAKGNYKIHRGKRYYIWETTNKYFTIGTLPKNFNNMNYWDIVLTNN
ncbi:hypothetical protein [Aquimarina sp. MMG016]|uniref:hypothetical protein n=1 Tax=Aquimarina sp. MMG016 TaxID=2822690 RepID=UPI001B39D7DD|nr:hypothetical protein [Aquimarina sp. MMG016]MBQ4819730.1 hypothetical protein [Aquimarina sp. MMG016]